MKSLGPMLAELVSSLLHRVENVTYTFAEATTVSRCMCVVSAVSFLVFAQTWPVIVSMFTALGKGNKVAGIVLPFDQCIELVVVPVLGGFRHRDLSHPIFAVLLSLGKFVYLLQKTSHSEINRI